MSSNDVSMADRMAMADAFYDRLDELRASLHDALDAADDVERLYKEATGIDDDREQRWKERELKESEAIARFAESWRRSSTL